MIDKFGVLNLWLCDLNISGSIREPHDVFSPHKTDFTSVFHREGILNRLLHTIAFAFHKSFVLFFIIFSNLYIPAVRRSALGTL